MFHGLLGELVSRQVILFPVVRCRSAMRVCCQFMKFRSSLVGIVWHSGPLFAVNFIFEPISFSSCPIPDTSVFLQNLLSAALFHRHFIPFPGDKGPTGRSGKRQYRCT
jgi:hypothetical protein